MNPFDLPGPQFLVLYALFALSVLGLLYSAKRAAETGEPGCLPVSDPYVIAYLRGGATETLLLGVTVLIDRQLLDMREADLLETRHGVSARHGANELERAILERCTRAEPAREVVEDETLQELTRRSYVPGLLQLDLIAGPETRARRSQFVGAAVVALVVVAAIKVAIGLSRNRPVSLLIVFAAIFSVVALLATRGARTVQGDRILDDLEVLFGALRQRAGELRPNASTNEMALLAAVFGLDALPEFSYPFVRAYRPAWTPNTSSCGTGSACGSSSSGGGCGGGGGGGGCGGGGCGGCGS